MACYLRPGGQSSENRSVASCRRGDNLRCPSGTTSTEFPETVKAVPSSITWVRTDIPAVQRSMLAIDIQV